jgi:hypothetical protein
MWSGRSGTVSVTSSQVAKRRPARAKEHSTFHGSMRLREAAYFGWNTISQRGCASMNKQHVGGAVAAQVVDDGVDPLDGTVNLRRGLAGQAGTGRWPA